MLPQPLILLVAFFLSQEPTKPQPSPQVRSPEPQWAEELREVHFPLPPRSSLVWIPGPKWGSKGSPPRFYHRLLDFPITLPLPKGRSSLFSPAQVQAWKKHGAHWIEDILLPHLVRQSARLALDPGPGRRGLEGLPKRCKPQQHQLPSFLSRKARDLPQFGFFERRKGGEWEQALLEQKGFPLRFPNPKRQSQKWNPLVMEQQWSAYEQLLQDLLQQLRWPLPKLPPQWGRVFLPDDGMDRGGIEVHEALDLGALSRRQDGRLGVWPEGVPVFSPLPKAKAIRAPRRDGIGFSLRLTRGGYRLEVLIFLYHLAPKGRPRLEGFSPQAPLLGWARRDPSARIAGLPKGNHLHLELVGPFRGKPNLLRLFIAHRLLRSLLAAPSSGPPIAPLLLPKTLPSPPWAQGRQLLQTAFQEGIELKSRRLDRTYWIQQLRPILPHLPKKTCLEQLLSEFLNPLLQLNSR